VYGKLWTLFRRKRVQQKRKVKKNELEMNSNSFFVDYYLIPLGLNETFVVIVSGRSTVDFTEGVILML